MWLYLLILPYIIYDNIPDKKVIDTIIHNEDYIYNILDIKYGTKPQNIIYIPTNKWYYDPNYVRCISYEISELKLLDICYYNGTHVKRNNTIKKYRTWLVGESYCYIESLHIYERGICFHFLRYVYELYLGYCLLVCLIILYEMLF